MGNSISGRVPRETPMGKDHNLKDLIGQRFGRLLVVRRAASRKNGYYRARWECRCDCGNTHVAQGMNLKAGDVRSCGCLFQDFMKLEKRAPRPQCRKAPGEVAFLYLFTNYKSRAKKRGYSFLLSEDEFRGLITKSCAYCATLPLSVCKRDYDSMLYNGVDRIDNSLGYFPGNCVPCCRRCNLMKGTMSVQQFFDAIAAIHSKRVSASDHDVRGSESTLNTETIIQ